MAAALTLKNVRRAKPMQKPAKKLKPPLSRNGVHGLASAPEDAEPAAPPPVWPVEPGPDTRLETRGVPASPDPAGTSARSTARQDGAISALVTELEQRLRETIDAEVAERERGLEAGYRARVKRMRALTNEELRSREARIRRKVAEEHQAREQLLRGYYKKLMALANTISRQKAQLQEARRQFESKLNSANQLYRDIEDMRRMLDEQIGFLDEQAIEEIPRLSMSL